MKSWKLPVAETLPISNASLDDSMPTDCVNSNGSFSRQYLATDLESYAVFRLPKLALVLVKLARRYGGEISPKAQFLNIAWSLGGYT